MRDSHGIERNLVGMQEGFAFCFSTSTFDAFRRNRRIDWELLRNGYTRACNDVRGGGVPE